MIGARAFSGAAHGATGKRRQIGQFFVAVQTSDFFYEILFDFDVKAISWALHHKVRTFAREFETKTRKSFGHKFVGNIHADNLAAAIRAHANNANGRQIDALIVNGANAGFWRAADFKHELGNVVHVIHVRSPVHAAFEAIGGVRREVELTAATLDSHLLPEGRFNEDVDRIVGD